MNCTVCQSSDVVVVGAYRPYADYRCDVFDCAACGSRFAEHDGSVYETLHSSAGSAYSLHDQLAQLCRETWDRGGADALKKLLTRMGSKLEFVIKTISARPEMRNLLEIGCSRGYLTSYFIAAGYNILGVDVSASAIEAARSLFGGHFALADAPEVESRQPYDAIFHVGTIGCVEAPEAFTRELLGRLRSGGVLAFNSPNVAVCHELGEIWVAGTSPPDLVTLFHEDYWRTHYDDAADVEVTVCPLDGVRSLQLAVTRARGRRQLGFPGAGMLEVEPPALDLRKTIGPVGRAIRAGIRGALDAGQALKLVPRYSSDFGMYVVMTKK